MLPNLEPRRSFSKGLPQVGAGELFLRIVKETQSLFNIQNISNATVSEYLRKSIKSFTGAS